MTIEIHQPELEALIQYRLDSGRFATIEDVLLNALQSSPAPEAHGSAKVSLGQFLRDSPLWGSDLQVERAKDDPRPVEF